MKFKKYLIKSYPKCSFENELELFKLSKNLSNLVEISIKI